MVQGQAGDGVAGGRRGMGVDHGFDLRVLLIDSQMHLHLAGGLLPDDVVQVHQHQHLIGHKALGDGGVHHTVLSLTLQLMLPSLEATKFFHASGGPLSRMACLASKSLGNSSLIL